MTIVKPDYDGPAQSSPTQVTPTAKLPDVDGKPRITTTAKLQDADGRLVVASSTASAEPTVGNTNMYIVWYEPPVTGPLYYQFYDHPSSSQPVLSNHCDEDTSVKMPTPLWEPTDPKAGRIDSIRKKGNSLGPNDRRAPGNLGLIQILVPSAVISKTF
jgi:hypothetical protein